MPRGCDYGTIHLKKEVWSYPRLESCYETTLPTFLGTYFKHNFGVYRETLACIVEVCVSMRRQNMTMHAAVPLRKQVVMALYWLASSAKDGTVANVFKVSQLLVHNTYREFIGIIAG